VIIAGLPDAMITNVIFNNIDVKHPGGGNSLFAKVLLSELNSVPEKPSAYPEFSMFRELPAWGIYIRHAQEIQFSNLSLSCVKKDYRTAIVLDDVYDSKFLSTTIKEEDNKKALYQQNSKGIIFK
jgi:hypothetical protein